MKSFRDSVFFPVAMMFAGVSVFFLFLYLTGHDPNESPLTLIEWVIGGMLIGPGFGYLIKWKRMTDSQKVKAE
ncbi:hypothetical protein HJC06_30580 [Rhizobium sp. NLR9b]|uniref:hypothetical protein n=1 Tax=Rhizobium TaxID=379 RepID=UPI001C837BB0|nr:MULTISPECIES: hypothetical protein [Rhizobium]MBX5230669.1 hypothetical protein [Rhizobium sp. NLR9b]MBX5291333.1 hypothetical protein [Rhizobium sp. NLR10b]MBY3516539.1 hypothetical protein [Rhizobium laguerreae]